MKTDSNIAEIISNKAKAIYPVFSDYYNLLSKGLRKKALIKLDIFLHQLEGWDYKQRAKFCSFLFHSSQMDNDLEVILTTNLADRFVLPTLTEMIANEPTNFLLLKWHGQYFRDSSSLKKAFTLNPNDYSLKLLLLAKLENDLWLSIHHLPDFYLGDYTEDIQDINLAFSILATCENEINLSFLNLFVEFKESIEAYRKSRNATTNLNNTFN